MNVKMLADFETYPDGVTRTRLKKGDIIQLRDGLAERLVARGLCEPTDPAIEPDTGDAGGAPAAAADDPIAGMNAKDAAKAVAEFTVEQLDAIPADESRKGVLEAVEARRAELAADSGDAGDAPAAAADDPAAS